MNYVHGYSERERERLQDQAETLTDLLHGDTHFAAGSRVLEAGCGVGAQTVILASNSPEARFVSVDISADSLRQAERVTADAGFHNVEFLQADLFHLPFAEASFDHVFVCFVLEHLSDPVGALKRLRAMLRPGGSITVIEGDHGSAYFYPPSAAAQRAIQCLNDLQASDGGNSLIGRQVYPLLVNAGFVEPRVSPRMVYVDVSKPEWVEGFTKNTFTAMIEGVREAAIQRGLIGEAEFDQGIADLRRTAEGVFCYTFFKGIARR